MRAYGKESAPRGFSRRLFTIADCSDADETDLMAPYGVEAKIVARRAASKTLGVRSARQERFRRTTFGEDIASTSRPEKIIWSRAKRVGAPEVERHAGSDGCNSSLKPQLSACERAHVRSASDAACGAPFAAAAISWRARFDGNESA